MSVDQTCKILCRKLFDPAEIGAFAEMIDEEYRNHMLLDNLPIAMSVFHESVDGGESIKAYETGYPIGHVEGPEVSEEHPEGTTEDAAAKEKRKLEEASKERKLYLFNHLRFTILYHEDPTRHGMRIVGFEAEPLSIQHTYDKEPKWEECVGREAGADGKCSLKTCGADRPANAPPPDPLVLDKASKAPKEVVWTYDVQFRLSPIKWSTRWDTYLQSADDAQVHWFSILNSFMIVLFLSGIVAMIMVRTLRRDFQRYEQQDLMEEGQEETGWKLVHGDVFRPPALSGWLAVLVGTGVQLAVSMGFLMIFACAGFLSPANRGALMQAMLFLFAFTGAFGGFTAGRLFRMFRGTRWKANGLYTALLFPGVTFAIFFGLNLLIWGHKSSGAVPFGTLFALLCMWFGISTPLVMVGAYFGFKKQPVEHPVRTNQIPRQVPNQPWFVNHFVSICVGGVLPFGAVFVEVFYVLSSIWLHQFYYLFGFLFLVQLILLMTCAEITIVLCYFQLCCEDYRWWWRAFLTSGACSGYLFLYSIYYAATRLQMARAVAGVLYVGYMFIISFSLFLVTGAIGFLACLAFVRAIYSAIKID